MSSIKTFRDGGGRAPFIFHGNGGSLPQQIEALRQQGKLPDRLQFATGDPPPVGRKVVISSGERTRNQMMVYSGEDGWKSVYIRIEPSGVRTENYAKNPVLLFLHGWGGAKHPIGTCNVYMEMGRLCGELSFHGLTEDSQTIERLWDAGVYRAVSLSILVDWDNYTVTEEEIIFAGSELLEVSVVDVGADASAVRQALNKGTKGRVTMEEEEVVEDQGQESPGVMSVQQLVAQAIAAYFADEEFMAGLSEALLADTSAAVTQLQSALADMDAVIQQQAQMIRALSGEPVISKVAVPPFARPQRAASPPPPPPSGGDQAGSINRSRVSDAAKRRAGMIRAG